MGKRKMCYLIALLMAGVMSLIGLAGCNTYGMYEDGYYVFVQNKDRAEAAKLTELGQQQEVLVVPFTHNGVVVEQIGASSRTITVYTWNSDKLKTLYVPHTIKNLYPSALESCPQLEKVFLNRVEPVVMYKSVFFDIHNLNIYVPSIAYKKYLEEYGENTNYSEIGKSILEANVTFLYNYLSSPNNNYYWIDNVEVGEKIVEPQAPERNGYRFTGWYQDANCTEEWNFEQEVDGESVTLYAGWTAL